MHEVLQAYITPPRESAHRPVERYQGMVSPEEALRDVDALHYLMENRYAGWDYCLGRGIALGAGFAEVRALLSQREKVYVSDLCRWVHRAFEGRIVDNHLSFASPMTGRLGFSSRYAAYFADLLVEKRGNSFVVVRSGTPGVKVLEVLLDEGALFATLSPPGRAYFLAGMRDFAPRTEMTLRFAKGQRTVALHPCRAHTKRAPEDRCLEASESGGLPILRSNCCDYVGALREGDDMEAIGRKYRGEKAIVWNNLGNEGGYSRIPRAFLTGLNGRVAAREYCAKLTSPVTEGRDCPRAWEVAEPPAFDPAEGAFDGTLLFLMNSETASSGETSVLYAKSLRHAVFIGENSMGCNTFGNTATYRLPHSGILACIPNMVNLCVPPSACEEGKGFAPDFWVDAEDVQGEAIRWWTDRARYAPPG